MNNYKNIVYICLLLINTLFNYTFESSMEPCLAAQGVNLSFVDTNDTNVILPIDCQCNNNDIICIDLNLYNQNHKQEIKFPTLSILFQPNEMNYLLPKQRFSFFGYKELVSNAFRQVKFVNDLNTTNFNDQTIFIDFIESNYFPTNTFNSFGNLAESHFDSWPKVIISIVLNENNSLVLEPHAISNMSISILSFEFGQAESKFNTSSLSGSQIQNLIFKNSNGFTGFDQLTSQVEVRNLAIDKCYNFNLDNQSLPNFANLESLTLTSNDLLEINNSSFSQFTCLKYLSLKRNLINEITVDTFNGIESSLISLDLSYNPLNYFDWNVMDSFGNLTVLDLSYTNISSIESFEKKWPNSFNLESIALNGYLFNNESICAFDPSNSINLKKVLIELDPYHECNCFVFYIYKSYRLNRYNNISDWLLANRTPICYKELYNTYSNFTEIRRLEDECDFEFTCSFTTSYSTISPSRPSTKSTTGTTLTPSSPKSISNLVELNQASIIVIACLAALSFVLIISLICLITYFVRKPQVALKDVTNEEYYRV